ncbi:phage tail family protein [Thermoanaerobacterium thermosaccharolyticum]|uniref:phage tail family protein n=1 Tax=Thermoanaerobacterium thermosaccharolyticum TaxID=1517 RepID=UPI001CE25782|nr:phage tail family protein [Thermoanaerobacterium thermosaccharolyticum]
MGFIYNGISSQSMKIRARLTKWQVSPALRNSFETVPGKAGIADFGCDISERNIIISCSVLPQRSFAELVSVLDNVAEWLNPENGLKQLVIDDLPTDISWLAYQKRLTVSGYCGQRAALNFGLFVPTRMLMR